MNTDPVGTQGAQNRRSDIDIAALGGAEFAKRLEGLAKAKDEARKAFEQLQLGSDIVAMRDDVQRKLQMASDAKAAADAYSVQVKREADNYAAKVRREADDHRARSRIALKAACDAAEEAKQNALDDQAAAKRTLAAAKQTAAEAAELKQGYELKVAKIQSAIAAAREEHQ
jgi:hypothetical protein